MKKKLKKVKEFHRAFNIPYNEIPTVEISEQRKELRYELMKEENEEYLEAVKSGSLIDTADALGDMLYILCGTILEHGMQYKIDEVFNEIHRSNMSKLENGKPIYREDGKVLKGSNYFKPNLTKILQN
ncbi:nucleoside triphosphate pyrophosphohydrolase family protein [Tenacibaculum phage JQ]|nr:nucleoside triphosphate pyrophosphohydrolase family protein [Tenacibaculum phage JQ]